MSKSIEEVLREMGVTDPEQITKAVEETKRRHEEAKKNFEMIGPDIEKWADHHTEELPADPAIPDGMLCKWEGITRKQPVTTAGEVYTLVNEYGMETGVTAVIKRVMGKLCVYITDQKGEVDHVGVVSYKEAPVEVAVHRFAAENCPCEKIKV